MSDPVTTAVIRGFLESTCRDMGQALTHNARSPIFIEGQDFSCAILDPTRELVAAANYDPSHLASMPFTVDAAVLEQRAENIGHGDVIVVNDPYRGGTHLPDVTMFTPVIVDGVRVAYSVTRAHHLDIGGMAPGSVPGGARDVFAEGLRIPPSRWMISGQENHEVLDYILSNVRLPDIELSDMRAQVASLMTGRARVGELCAKFGVEAVLEAMDEIKAQSESQVRAFLTSVPDGEYSFTDYMDRDGNNTCRYAIRANVKIAGDSMHVDFTGTSEQADGAINLPYAATASAVFNSVLQLAGGDIPFNHGCFRAVSLHAPRKSLVNAQPPAPTFGCSTDTPMRVIDTIVGALATVIPDRAIAGSYGTCNIVAGSGTNEHNEDFLYWFFYEGGMGASGRRDGWNVTPNQSANFRDYPIEIIESEYPLVCDTVALIPDSGGAGKFRGGLGSVHQFTFTAETVLSGFADRHEIQPYGLAGGHAGMGSRYRLRRAGTDKWLEFDEFAQSSSKWSGVIAYPGDSLEVINGGGGGFGDPAERDPDLLARDLREGLITEAGVQAYQPGAVDTALTAFSSPEEIGEVRPPAPEDETADKFRTAVADVVGCRTECPLKADPNACAFHHDVAPAFWSTSALSQWARRNCPRADLLLPIVQNSFAQ
ncbi:hydantoinase B/oxoprolinase family protein [Dactylosporangium fulvum]|uniref:Hydantoinase B/oxoprolinase family protein n=1 Tax=Dactylosporangium fulvum TaxID=53359 RepID=A0ABY5W6F5_9ACTN|nr:hydantoinase B/oxoprolinase family protein [Dactylosporangium fulvum]UWP85657.1 hydantoinase B/oxoprolinase family protein [Dactylosporangium fulvum]